MKTVSLPFRLPARRHGELRQALKQDGLSLQRFFEEVSTAYLAERQARARFELRAAKGNPERGLKLLGKIRRRIETKPA